MRLGLIARADNTGLGYQTLEFYRHMNPDKTLVVDIGHLNGNVSHPERYPEKATVCKGIPNQTVIDSFLEDLDVVFVAEAPYNYYLYEAARRKGVKTAVQYNYEFFDWFAHPNWPKPDMLIAPSRWNYGVVDKFCEDNGIQHVYLHVPIDRKHFKFMERRDAVTFLHTAGKSAAHDRNGTETVMRAAPLLKSDAQIVVHFQGEQGLAHQATHPTAYYRKLYDELGQPNNLTLLIREFADNADIYAMGDVLILPRRYGGNCLPLNEALSCGLPAIMPAIDPNYKFLPQNWLIQAEKVGEFTPRTTIDIFDVDPMHLAKRIDRFAQMDEAEFLRENVRANNIAERISWDNMRHAYQAALEGLCG